VYFVFSSDGGGPQMLQGLGYLNPLPVGRPGCSVIVIYKKFLTLEMDTVNVDWSLLSD